jgi:hypothetical protein
VWIDNAVWVSTPHSLVHRYECFGYPDVKAGYPPISLHAPVTWRAIILNRNI